MGGDLSGRISFEPAVEADAGLLLEMVRAFHHEEGRVLGVAGEAAVAAIAGGEPLARAWIARRADRVVGYVVITLGYSIEYGGRNGFIDDLYVVPDWRGQGLGRQLLGFAVTQAMKRLGSGRCIWKWRRGTRRRTGFIGQRASRTPTAG